MTDNIGVLDDQRDFWFVVVDLCVWEDETLSTVEKAVYTALCTFASVEGRTCWPSISVIAKRVSCSDRSVNRALDVLEERGYLKITRRFKDNARIPSAYSIIGHKSEKGLSHSVARGYDTVSQGVTTECRKELEPIELEPKDIPPISPKGEDRPEPSEEKEQTSPEKAKDNPLEEWFDKFWEHYPKKADKKRAKRTFMRIFSRASPKKQRERMENLILRLTRYVADRIDEDPKYTKNPTTWLNAHDYDEPPGEDEILYKPIWKKE